MSEFYITVPALFLILFVFIWQIRKANNGLYPWYQRVDYKPPFTFSKFFTREEYGLRWCLRFSWELENLRRSDGWGYGTLDTILRGFSRFWRTTILWWNTSCSVGEGDASKDVITQILRRWRKRESLDDIRPVPLKDWKKYKVGCPLESIR